jgi:hypothetical protein
MLPWLRRGRRPDQPALLEPPDLIRQIQQQILVVGSEQNSGAGLAQPVERHDRPRADQLVVRGEGVIEQQRVHWRKVEGIGRAKEPAPCAYRDRPPLRRHQAGCQAKQHAFTRAILADDADGGTIRGNHIERVKRRTTHFSKLDGHPR